MKKILAIALFFAIVSQSQAQNFFNQTCFRGAFAPAPTPMWTTGWTEFDAQNKVYPAATVTVTANITSNTTFTSNNVYLLSGQIFVKNNAVLTIQPGTVILGDKSIAGAGLFITKGSQLIAQGTINQPIVFTSNQAPGARGLGDWGGLVLLGQATNNLAGGVGYVEGLAQSPDTEHGGNNDNDNSGTVSYVRIEFGGYVYQPNKEINGLTLGSVGSATTLDHIQVSFTNDDAFEWFGGTVNAKYLVSFRNLDDDFDTDNGYRGNVQYGLIVRDPAIADNPSVSTSEGFESDNDAGGTTATPQTSAIFSNITAIGPYRGNTASTIASGHRRGARIRRNSGLKIFNSVFMDFARGVHIDGALCEANAQNGTLKFKNNIISGTSTGRACEVNVGSTFQIQNWFASNQNDSLSNTVSLLTTPYNYTSPDYRPSVNSPLLSNANFSDASLAGNTKFLPVSAINALGTTVCAGQSLTFNDQSSNNPTGWSWTVNGGNPSAATSQNVSATFSTPGNYTVSLIASNAVGSSCNNSEVTVTVNALPNVQVSSATICFGNNTTLTASGASNYVWSGNASGSTFTTPNLTSNSSFTVTGTDNNNCSNSAIATVSVNPLPQILVNNATICSGASATLTASGALTYTWSDNTTGATLVLNNLNSTTSYSVTGLDANNCSNTAIATVIVNSSPALTTSPTSAQSNCAASTGSLTGAVVSGSGVLNYNWTDASNTTVGNTLNLLNQPAGVYSLIVTDGNNCVSNFGPFSISNPNAPSPPSITALDTAVCAGQPINLIATSNASNPGFAWTGPSSSSVSSFLNVNSSTLNDGGTYAVTVSSNGCVSSPAFVTITVYAPPVVPIITQNVTQLVSSAGSGNQWFLNGNALTDTTVTFTFTQNGIYTVQTTNANGCTSVSQPFVVNNVSVNNILTNVFVRLFPNPANDYFIASISNEKNENVNLKISDVTGKVILSDSFLIEKGIENQLRIDLTSCSNGLYYVTFFSDGFSKTTLLSVSK